VVVYGDGGGKAPALPKPVHGAERVARLILSARWRGQRVVGVSAMRLATINGQPGAILFDAAGQPVVAIALDIADERVQAMRAVANPDKLRHLRGALEA
jgi:RNA polymerase sigma-70 factor (ECF subfamily)